ncbi:MAG: hypothetical protein ACO3EK_18920, partial [Alphaproteobacteria bacterium]
MTHVLDLLASGLCLRASGHDDRLSGYREMIPSQKKRGLGMGRDVEGAGGVPGRIRKAPENFLSAADIAAVASGRRDVLRRGFAAALGLGGAAAAGA